MRQHVPKLERLILPEKLYVACRTAGIVPLPAAYDRLKIYAVKLPIAHENDLSAFGDEALNLLEKANVHLLRQMSLLALHDKPGDRQNPLSVDHSHHKRQASPADNARIYREDQWELRKT